jgi:hypothetical protein
MVPINALYFYEQQLEAEYLGKELPDYSNQDDEFDIDGYFDEMRDLKNDERI